MSEDPSALDPEDHVLRLLSGKWIAQAVSAAATLGVSDVLRDGPLEACEIARALRCDEQNLQRLLAVLVGEGLYTIDEFDRYHLTPSGHMLAASDESLKDLAAFVGSPSQWAPWAALADCVRTGRSAYQITHGSDLYTWLEQHPEDARRYDEGVDRFTLDIALALAERAELRELRRVVDVGGGLGSLLAALLARWPHLDGVLVDLPHVLERAASRLPEEVRPRVELVGGSFFEPLPTGGDIYVLKHVIHNWGDAEAAQILRRCRDAMSDGAQLWLVEGVLHQGEGRSLQRLMDLEMMVLFDRGCARSKPQLRKLLGEAGFTMEQTTFPLGRFARLLVAKPS